MGGVHLSDLVLAFGMGVAAHLAILHVALLRRSEPAHRFVALWCGATSFFLAGRFVQIESANPAIAVLGARAMAAAAPPLALAAVGIVRAFDGERTDARVLAPWAATAGLLSLCILLSPWFVQAKPELRTDWFGREHLAFPPGPGLFGLLLLLVGLCAHVFPRALRTRALERPERRLFLISLLGYMVLAISSLLSALRLIPIPITAEVAPLVFGLGLNALLVSRHRRLQEGLETAVESRTREMRGAHERLRESEARYRELFENAPIGVVALDQSGTVTAANPQAAAIVGRRSARALHGRNLLEGSAVPGSPGRKVFLTCLREGRVVSSELAHTFGSGRSTELRVTMAPIRRAGSRAHEVEGVLALMEDLTERRALEARLRQGQKMEAVGQLAAGIAHEINNPMAFVRSNLSMLRGEWEALGKQVDDPEAVRRALAECEELLNDALEGADRTIAIVRDIREFSHGGFETREVDLDALVRKALRMASTHRPQKARLIEHYGALPPTQGAPGPLGQVFLNLILNAYDAVREGGDVHVGTRACDDEACVCIADEGPGIAPEHLDRIFDPFFTTKQAGQGTGLGLFVSYEIVRLHEGSLTAHSVSGEGSVFEVRLPLRRR